MRDVMTELQLQKMITSLQQESTLSIYDGVLDQSVKKLCRKIYGCGLKTITENPSSNLYSLAYLFMILTLNNKNLRNSLINEISTNFHYFSSLKTSYSMSSQNLVKLMINMLEWIGKCREKKIVYEFLDEFTVTIEIFSLFFRMMLKLLKFPEAQDLQMKLNTHQTYTILTQYFDLKCKKEGLFYMFPNDNIFILSPFDTYFIIGQYFHDPVILEKKSQEYNLASIINNETKILENTPEFGTENDPLKGQENMYSFKKDNSQQFGPLSLRQMKKNSAQRCSTERKYQNPEAEVASEVMSPSSYHSTKCSRFMNYFLPETPQPYSAKRNFQSAGSGFFHSSDFSSKIHPKLQNIPTKQSLSCKCVEEKQKKIQIIPTVVQVIYIPQKQVNKSKFPQFLRNRSNMRYSQKKMQLKAHLEFKCRNMMKRTRKEEFKSPLTFAKGQTHQYK